MSSNARQLAVITGASSGIGLELARLCAQDKCDLVIAADDHAVVDAAEQLAVTGVTVTPVQCDLSTTQGVDKLRGVIASIDRPVDVLIANAGRGLGRAFLDQDIQEALKVAHTNIDGTIYLVYQVGRAMRLRKRGRILITGSIAGLMPGTFQAVYNGTKAFLDSFSVALSNELKDTGVTVTCLLPGATETNFFERADMLDTKVGADDSKADPKDVAWTGYEAMKRGEVSVVHGFGNKVRAAVAAIAPEGMLAEMHRKMAEPGTAKQ
jgi:short-subunit dehydrogenase